VFSKDSFRVSQANGSSPPIVEFVALMALLTSLVALSIDAMLPALPMIGRDLGALERNDHQLVISAFFFGFAVGQVFYGPVSDSVGRKPLIYVGLFLFLAGCLMSILAPDFEWMLAGRLLQGIGVAGPRSVTLALIRDRFAGRAMARIMSFIMAVFILVPVLAPAIGQGILLFAGWEMIFWLFVGLATASVAWFSLRQPETLPVELRTPWSLARVGSAVLQTFRNRAAFGYMITAGFVFGGFVGYLNSAQQIFQEQYALGVMFPVTFGILSLGIGAASVVNARLVMRFGMRFLTMRALVAVTLLSIAYFLGAALAAGHPPLWSLMAYCMAVFFCMGLLFGNLNALAMEPLGHVAGVGAAMVGSLTTLMSAVLGTAIGQAYDGTVLPLVGGFGLCCGVAIVTMRWADRHHP